MVKKKFIDKRSAVTYNLVFRSTEDADDVPERVLIEADKGVGVGRVDAEVAEAAAAAATISGRRYPPGHPLAWLEDEPAKGPVSEERRQELIELGFPDDGYDYLKHMRVLGRGAASLEGTATPSSGSAAAAAAAAAVMGTSAPGPSVYMAAPAVLAPEEDWRLIDASRLTVMQAVQEEQAAAVMAGGVTAFSRERPRAHGVDKRELEELEAMMQQAEQDEEFGGAEGDGDLLDDFILAATEQGPEPESGEEMGDGGELEFSDVESAEEHEGMSLAGSGDPGVSGSQAGSQVGRCGLAPARPGSIASTYWRDERSDRKNLLTVIDERFEHLALEYDEEEIGDLEEQGEQIRGFADVAEFDNLLDEFLEAHRQSQAVHEGNVAYTTPHISQVAREMEFFGFDDADAALAVQRAHEAVRRAEEEAARKEKEGNESEGDDGEGGRLRRGPAFYEQRECWDCESVLSLRSNLDNHPGSISEPRSARPWLRGCAAEDGVATGGLIRLDPRGIPMGVLPPWHGMGAASESTGSGAQAGGEGGTEAAAAMAVPVERRKDEMPEEKRVRKTAVKQAQRMARTQKKELKGMFKQAEQVAQRLKATAQPQAAIKLP